MLLIDSFETNSFACARPICDYNSCNMQGIAVEKPRAPPTQSSWVLNGVPGILKIFMSAQHPCSSRLVLSEDYVVFLAVVCCDALCLPFFVLEPGCLVCRGVHLGPVEVEFHEKA
jgi:hypothetical protein